MTRFPGFSPAALRFLRQLKRHNRRDWFEANRHIYDDDLKPTLATLVEAIDDRLAVAVPEIVGDTRRSIFRIHRDVRFSKDKSPYKTNVAAWFFHRRAGKGVGGSAPDGGAAGFYLHVEPGANQVGGGLWMPLAPQLAKVREAIAAKPERFAATMTGSFRRRFAGLDDEAVLVRPPRGFPADHPAIGWLKYRSFTATQALADAALASPTLPDVAVKAFTALRPFVRFLNDALGYPPDERRVY
ncbi:MAG: DUF2461 domain-containing protein [Gemmatimonadota bacterium]|jgi:uncharacterized protein (TIGR02453 family)|nr:DUF2461 domain-containing protein [Gemmatimonadota bacterium]